MFSVWFLCNIFRKSRLSPIQWYFWYLQMVFFPSYFLSAILVYPIETPELHPNIEYLSASNKAP